MSSLSNILQQGRRALQVQQLAMQVIGHNTTNAGTDGYSRRRLDLQTAVPFETGQWDTGAGVDVQRLARIRDTFLDNQIRTSTSVSAFWSAREDQLGRVEEIFDALGESNLGNLLDGFWNGWHDLANDPENETARYALRDRSNALANTIKRVHSQLEALVEETNGRIIDAADRMNTITTAIADLNVQIVRSEINGEEASDLRDSRDLLVEQLAEITDIAVQQQGDGSINVYVGGQIIVQRDLALTVRTDVATSDPKREVVLTLGTSPFSWTPSGGELGALYEQRDRELPDMIGRLDRFAREFSSAVNQLHVNGYGLNGSHGQEFFSASITGAADFALSADILNDVSFIAAASSSNAPGDNSLALAIGQLQHGSSIDGITLDEWLRNMPLEAGSRRAAAIQQRDIEGAVLENTLNRRASISGVNLDEEMAKLIESQKAYEAAAKIVQTVDEMMQTILNLK